MAGGVGGVQPARGVCTVIVCAADFTADKDHGWMAAGEVALLQKKSTKDLHVFVYLAQGGGVSVFFSFFVQYSVSLCFALAVALALFRSFPLLSLKLTTESTCRCSSASANLFPTSQFTSAPQNHVPSGACTLHDQCDTQQDATGVKMDSTPVWCAC
jgi:hypothetical protein